MVSKQPLSSHNYAKIEVERRFLLSNTPDDLNEESYLRIIDRYITDTRLRLRRVESPAGEILALKFGQKYRSPDQDFLSRTMTTLYLNQVEYETLASLNCSTLTKRRYPYIYIGSDVSIDIFDDDLDGLVLLEIQSTDEVDINSIPFPPYAIREVTAEPFFTGGELAQLTKEEFQIQASNW
jgi:CYTH domain-containing protein